MLKVKCFMCDLIARTLFQEAEDLISKTFGLKGGQKLGLLHSVFMP